MDLLRGLRSLIPVFLARAGAMGLGEDGGVGEQTVIRGLIIAGAIIVVGIIVAAVVTHAHSIANTVNGAGG